MSYHIGTHNTDLRNRQNILQDLQQQKQQLLQQGTSVSQISTSGQHNMLGRPLKHDMPLHPTVSMNRRSALEYASTHSSGYFVASDSTVGNPILPVVPRVDDS